MLYTVPLQIAGKNLGGSKDITSCLLLRVFHICVGGVLQTCLYTSDLYYWNTCGSIIMQQESCKFESEIHTLSIHHLLCRVYTALLINFKLNFVCCVTQLLCMPTSAQTQYGSVGVERGQGGAKGPLEFKLFSKNGCFLSFEWEKTNFTTFSSLENPPSAPHWKKSFQPPMYGSKNNKTDSTQQDFEKDCLDGRHICKLVLMSCKKIIWC